MKTTFILLIVTALLSTGYSSVKAPRSFVGTAANNEDWPYRYRITQDDGQWSGDVDLQLSNGWVQWDTMQISDQSEKRLEFSAAHGTPGKAFPFQWHLDLGDTSGDCFTGRLTGGAFYSSFIDLEFTPWNEEPE